MLTRRPRKHRPVLRYHGGKFMIAPWVISHFAPHEAYTEVFGGGASVLLRKPRSAGETYNDLDNAIVGIFRVLQDPFQSSRLVELLKLTPYSREEFYLAYEPHDCPIETARRTIIRSFMGFGSDGTNGKYRTGYRATVTKAKKTPASEWANYPDQLALIIERFRSVNIENTDAFKLLPRLDGPSTLHYVDPPYLPETRSRGNRRRGQGFHVYTHELETDDHIRLLEILLRLEGMVALSGYFSEMYQDTLKGWECVTKKAYAYGGRDRLEHLWLNPALCEARKRAAMNKDPACPTMI